MVDSKTREFATTDVQASGATEFARLTIVEEGTELKGSVSSTCPVVVRGKVSGELAGPALTVSPSGAVAGRVKVGTLVSQGEIAGEFDADHATIAGKVSDDTVIRARTLDVKLAAEGKMTVSFGETRLEIGEEPKR
jgi:cytoskeletal protein CcmA (bactofilin family)